MEIEEPTNNNNNYNETTTLNESPSLINDTS
jgi:hypothetical protein